MGGATPDPPAHERDALIAQLRRDIDGELDVRSRGGRLAGRGLP